MGARVCDARRRPCPAAAAGRDGQGGRALPMRVAQVSVVVGEVMPAQPRAAPPRLDLRRVPPPTSSDRRYPVSELSPADEPSPTLPIWRRPMHLRADEGTPRCGLGRWLGSDLARAVPRWGGGGLELPEGSTADGEENIAAAVFLLVLMSFYSALNCKKEYCLSKGRCILCSPSPLYLQIR